MIVAEAIELTLVQGGATGDVLRFMLRVDDLGATDDEIAEGLGWKVNAVQARRVQLCYAGLVERTDKKRDGAGGRPSTVWRAVPPEREQVVIREVLLSHQEKVAAREQLTGTIRRCYTPDTVPAELAKLARWLKFKIEAHEVAR